MRMIFILTFILSACFAFAQSKEDVILRGGTISYSHGAGVKPFLDISPGLRAKSGIGVGLGFGFTTIPNLEVTAIPLFMRVSYLPLDAVVSPAFQFHFGYTPFNKEVNGISYQGGLFLHVSGGVGFNIKKNRGLLLQAGYGKIKVNGKTTAGGYGTGTTNYDGWMALLGFKF